jgi:hypothetical protein
MSVSVALDRTGSLSVFLIWAADCEGRDEGGA